MRLSNFVTLFDTKGESSTFKPVKSLLVEVNFC